MDDATRKCFDHLTRRMEASEAGLASLVTAIAHNHALAVRHTACIEAIRDVLKNVPDALQLLNTHLEN